MRRQGRKIRKQIKNKGTEDEMKNKEERKKKKNMKGADQSTVIKVWEVMKGTDGRSLE
jgi:hypothetical protein